VDKGRRRLARISTTTRFQTHGGGAFPIRLSPLRKIAEDAQTPASAGSTESPRRCFSRFARRRSSCRAASRELRDRVGAMLRAITGSRQSEFELPGRAAVRCQIHGLRQVRSTNVEEARAATSVKVSVKSVDGCDPWLVARQWPWICGVGARPSTRHLGLLALNERSLLAAGGRRSRASRASAR